MQSWMWGIVAGVPIVAAGVAYSMGAFSTNIPAINQQIKDTTEASTAFTGDTEEPHLGGRRKHKKTKKAKTGNKKTNRRK